MTAATIGKWTLTHAGTSVEEVLDAPGVGIENTLVGVTNWDSPAGQMEYIGGLADGVELQVEANYIPAATGQIALMGDVEAAATASFVLTYDGTDTFSFDAVCKSYKVVPSTTDQNKIQFGLKISGGVIRA